MRLQLKHIFFLLFFISKGSAPIYSQEEYMDLLLLYVDEKYDICFSKSMKYTLKDKTKNHPLPYLYIAMSSFEMSQDHKYTNLHPKAYKTAISFTAKYRKKDKVYKYKTDASPFIDKFKLVLMEDIENFMMENTESSFAKAASLSKKTCAMDPDDYGAKLLYGHLCNLTKNKSTAKEYLKISKEKLAVMAENKFGLKYLTKSQQFILRYALIEMASFYQAKNPTQSKEILNLGKHFFYAKNEDSKIEFSQDYKSFYDKL
jgi:hypothetical protein